VAPRGAAAGPGGELRGEALARVTVVGLGPGDPASVPAAALRALRGARRVLAPPLEPALAAALGVELAELGRPEDAPAGAVIAAPDPEAHRLARALPEALCVPERGALRARAIGAEVARLAAVGLRLRRECPWDREQTAATIVPHTVEEAFEVAEAVAGGDDAHLADELGDLLFQSVFLAQLLEERGAADLGRVARGQADKLVARHPHVYGDAAARTAQDVRGLWDRRKREERGEGIFHGLAPGLPALALATKTARRAAAVGFRHPDAPAAIAAAREELEELAADPGERELGDLLLAAVVVAARLEVDPELALRAAASRFRARVERAARLAAEAGEDFTALDAGAQLGWYARAAG
jgi:MazG family protein